MKRLCFLSGCSLGWISHGCLLNEMKIAPDVPEPGLRDNDISACWCLCCTRPYFIPCMSVGGKRFVRDLSAYLCRFFVAHLNVDALFARLFFLGCICDRG